MRRVATLGVLLLLATACGSRVAIEDRPIAAAGRGGIVPQTSATGRSAADVTGKRSSESGTGAGAQAAGKKADDFFEPKTKGDFALSIVVRPLCVEPGSTGIASGTTKPSAQLALMVSYSDRNVAGPYTFTTADATGRYAWVFAIPPGAPTGRSEVIVGAVDWETGDGVTGRTGFTIAERC